MAVNFPLLVPAAVPEPVPVREVVIIPAVAGVVGLEIIIVVVPAMPGMKRRSLVLYIQVLGFTVSAKRVTVVSQGRRIVALVIAPATPQLDAGLVRHIFTKLTGVHIGIITRFLRVTVIMVIMPTDLCEQGGDLLFHTRM